jgi:DNA-binding GntR family transcriptional regulator
MARKIAVGASLSEAETVAMFRNSETQIKKALEK